MAAALPALVVAGTVLTAAGIMNDAEARKDAAQRQQQIDNRNAAFAREQGEMEVVQQARRNYMRMSAARAGYGASGIRQEGSALDVLDMAAQQAEIDTQNIRRVAQMRAMGYEDSAALEGMRASYAQRGGYYAAAGSLLAGGAKAYGYAPGAGTPMPTGGDSQSQQIS